MILSAVLKPLLLIVALDNAFCLNGYTSIFEIYIKFIRDDDLEICDLRYVVRIIIPKCDT